MKKTKTISVPVEQLHIVENILGRKIKMKQKPRIILRVPINRVSEIEKAIGEDNDSK